MRAGLATPAFPYSPARTEAPKAPKETKMACDHPLDGHVNHGPWCEPTSLPTPWRKPSGTRHGPELRLCGDGHVEIRNSRWPTMDDGFLAFSRAEFGEFLRAAKAGEFDDLADEASPR